MSDAAAALWPRGSGVRLTENYNLEGVVGQRHHIRLHPLRMTINQDSDFCGAIVTYSYAKGCTFGRQFGSGFQSMNKHQRRLLAHTLYHDLDIVNCYPSILLQIAQRAGIAMPELDRYVNDRAVVLQEVADYVGGVHATHSLCKTLVIITLHAGDYTHHPPKLSSTGHSMIPATPTCPFLVALATPQRSLRWRMPCSLILLTPR